MGMKNEKKGFFSRMLSSEHKVFETSMFGISVVLTLALVIGIGYYISVAFFNHNTVTDEEMYYSREAAESSMYIFDKAKQVACVG